MLLRGAGQEASEPAEAQPRLAPAEAEPRAALAGAAVLREPAGVQAREMVAAELGAWASMRVAAAPMVEALAVPAEWEGLAGSVAQAPEWVEPVARAEQREPAVQAERARELPALGEETKAP
jgi:hypothetical protein